MNRCLPYLLAGALLGLAQAGPQNNRIPFSITISAAQPVFKTGSEVRIKLVFTNTSALDVPYERPIGTGPVDQGEFFTDVEIRDEKGDLMPQTSYYRTLRGKSDVDAKLVGADKSAALPTEPPPPQPRPSIRGSFVGVMLKPDESREESITLSKLYDLSQPGRYTVSASRRLSDVATDPNSKVVAVSNTLTITIAN